MSFWEVLIAGILAAVIAGIILVFLLPPFKGLRNKILVQVRKRSIIKTRKQKDLRLLGEIEHPLLLINQLRGFPDTPVKEIRDALFEIRNKAIQIKSKGLRDIKEKIILYSDKVNKLHINISLKEILALLVDNGAFNLVEEIREIIQIEIDKKKK